MESGVFLGGGAFILEFCLSVIAIIYIIACILSKKAISVYKIKWPLVMIVISGGISFLFLFRYAVGVDGSSGWRIIIFTIAFLPILLIILINWSRSILLRNYHQKDRVNHK
jgi:hypothetical protein